MGLVFATPTPDTGGQVSLTLGSTLKMEAKFRVVDTFQPATKEPPTFVMYGDVVDGEVAVGMLVRIPLNSAAAIEGEIGGVEFVEGTPTGSHLALIISVTDQAELEIWEGLSIGNEEVLVIESGASAA